MQFILELSGKELEKLEYEYCEHNHEIIRLCGKDITSAVRWHKVKDNGFESTNLGWSPKLGKPPIGNTRVELAIQSTDVELNDLAELLK